MDRALHELPEDERIDPREESELFRRLPAAAQVEFRTRWRRDDERLLEMRRLRLATVKLHAAEMAGLFVFFHLFGILRHPVVIVPALFVGATTGIVAAWLRAGPLLYPVLAGVGYLLSGGLNPFGALGLVGLAAVLGFVHQLRRFDGSEH